MSGDACCDSCAQGKACELDCEDAPAKLRLLASALRMQAMPEPYSQLSRQHTGRPLYVYELPAVFDGKPWEATVPAGTSAAISMAFGAAPPHAYRPVIDRLSVVSFDVATQTYVPVLLEYGFAPNNLVPMVAGPRADKQRVFVGTVDNETFYEEGGPKDGLLVPRDPLSGKWHRVYVEVGSAAAPTSAEVKLTADVKWVRTAHCFPPGTKRLAEDESL